MFSSAFTYGWSVDYLVGLFVEPIHIGYLVVLLVRGAMGFLVGILDGIKVGFLAGSAFARMAGIKN